VPASPTPTPEIPPTDQPENTPESSPEASPTTSTTPTRTPTSQATRAPETPVAEQAAEQGPTGDGGQSALAIIAALAIGLMVVALAITGPRLVPALRKLRIR